MPKDEFDKGLEEVLISIFEVDSNRAGEVAKTLTLNLFDSNFTRLDGIIGFDIAAKVVKEGKFLDYRNHQLEEYFELTTRAYSKLDISLPIPYKIFYSIESLKTFLGIGEEKKIYASKLEKLDISRYRILHKSNAQSVTYLDSLINNDVIKVKRDEHWAKSTTHNGTRGRDMIRNIAYQLVNIFNDLGLGRPEYEINYGQHQLFIYGKTRELLREIRDKVYSRQN